MKTRGTIELLIVCLYVDDLIYATNSISSLEELKRLMIDEFKMTDLCLMSCFLGLVVKQNGAGIFLSQEKYLTNLPKWFEMQDCNLVKIPLNTIQKFYLEDGKDKVDAHIF